MERGKIGVPEVCFADLPAHIGGNAANGIINVNRDMAADGVQHFEYQGRVLSHNISDYNVQALNTVLHENIHFNPYRKIANIVGMVMSSTEYIFTCCFKSMKDSYPFDTVESIEELSESGREELFSILDEEIAKLEKKLDKLEHRKKAETAEK